MALGDQPCQTLLEGLKGFLPQTSALSLLQAVAAIAEAADETAKSAPEIHLSWPWAQPVDKNLGHLKTAAFLWGAQHQGGYLCKHGIPLHQHLTEIQNGTGNTEVRPKNNSGGKPASVTVSDPVLAPAWLTQVWKQNRVQQNSSSESKFPGYDGKFLPLKFISEEECKRLSACSITLAVYGRKSWHIFPVCWKL